MSQTQFAELFDLTRASVGAYEEERAEPKIETLLTIAKYFSIPVEQILTKELTVNDIYNFDIFREDIFSSEKSKQSYLGQNILVPYLAKDRVADYLQNLHNSDYIDNLPYISLPFSDSPIGLALEHDSNDMVFHERGIYAGDILFCSRMADGVLSPFEPGHIYVVVTHDNIYVRRLSRTATHLALHPDNPNYETLQVPATKVEQLWSPRARMSRHVTQQVHEGLKLNALEERIKQLEKQIGTRPTKNKK